MSGAFLPRLPDAAGVKVWMQVLHVQLPEPDRTAFQFSRPWRKQITSDRKQLLLSGGQKRSLMEQLGHRTNVNGKSALMKHLEAAECDLFSCIRSSPIVSVAGRFDFCFSSDTEILSFGKKM